MEVEEITMSSGDWNTEWRQLATGVGGIAKLSFDTVERDGTISGAGEKTEHVSAKTRALIAQPVAISLRCDGSKTARAKSAGKSFASEEGITEGPGALVTVNAGVAVFDWARAMVAVDAVVENA